MTIAWNTTLNDINFVEYFAFKAPPRAIKVTPVARVNTVKIENIIIKYIKFGVY